MKVTNKEVEELGNGHKRTTLSIESAPINVFDNRQPVTSWEAVVYDENGKVSLSYIGFEPHGRVSPSLPGVDALVSDIMQTVF